MSESSSPYLHRESPKARYRYAPSVHNYRDRITATPEEQRARLETLRYKGYVRAGTLGCLMQQIGAFGRDWAMPMIGGLYLAWMLSWYWK